MMSPVKRFHIAELVESCDEYVIQLAHVCTTDPPLPHPHPLQGCDVQFKVCKQTAAKHSKEITGGDYRSLPLLFPLLCSVVKEAHSMSHTDVYLCKKYTSCRLVEW